MNRLGKKTYTTKETLEAYCSCHCNCPGCICLCVCRPFYLTNDVQTRQLFREYVYNNINAHVHDLEISHYIYE